MKPFTRVAALCSLACVAQAELFSLTTNNPTGDIFTLEDPENQGDDLFVTPMTPEVEEMFITPESEDIMDSVFLEYTQYTMKAIPVITRALILRESEYLRQS